MAEDRQRLPSLDLLAAEARAERELAFRHADEVDAKAGIVLGFAGAIVAVSAARASVWLVPGSVTAVWAALQCLVAFRPNRHRGLDLRRLRDDYLRSDRAFTQLRILDSQVAMAEQEARVLRRNDRRLRRGLTALGMAVGLLAAGTLASTIGG